MGKQAFVLAVLVILLCGGAAWWLIDGGYDSIQDRLFVENVFIDTSYDEIIIDKPKHAIHLTVSGDENSIIVRRETNLKVLEINGNGSSIILCEGIHHPEIQDNGQNNSIEYVSC